MWNNLVIRIESNIEFRTCEVVQKLLLNLKIQEMTVMMSFMSISFSTGIRAAQIAEPCNRW